MSNTKFNMWREKVIETANIFPICFGMKQEDIIKEFGNPDATSTMVKNGRPLIFKYKDIEFHFDERFEHSLFLIYSDDEIDLCIKADNEAK